MLKDLRNYILENKFKINIYDNNIDIINYIEIEHFDDKIIIVKYEKGIVTVKGDNLIITKLLEDELLINGQIRNIEFK
ncbi:MAG: YabP/YqfC family sporulation protein [Bacilli bacterium]|nr:YabP/YqfC family sporulation protein [Bacilli bacterium]